MPFETVDNLKLEYKFLGRTWSLNIFQQYEKFAWSIGGLAVISLLAWIVFGFDSTPMQFLNVFYSNNSASLIPSLLSGKIPTLDSLWTIYNSTYGKEMHWSAFVIYGFMYWALSKHFLKMGIKGSKNVAYSSSLMFLAIAFFEFYWMGSFAYFQNQPWVVTFMMPQLRILLQNIGFLTVGVLGVLYMWADSYVPGSKRRVYKFNWNILSVALVVLCVVVALVWWFYPWHVDSLNVPLANGEVWTNTRCFPQTLYTIDVNPLDSVNAGVQFWVGNDLIHAWNTMVKVIWTFTIMYVGRLKMK
jgi:hypothetical protein